MRIPIDRKIIYFIFIMITVFPNASFSAAKLALLIGNKDYKNNAELENTINDINLVGEKLNTLGFFVIKAENENKSKLKEELRAFHNKLRSGDMALIYYSGHGLQYQGTNFLVPIDADIKVPTEIMTETVSVDDILAYIEKASVKIVILDACRNNPYKIGSKGIGKGLQRQNIASQNMVIAFAAAPNQEASDGAGMNSPYALSLVNALSDKGRTLEQIFKKVRKRVGVLTKGKQTPWYNASLIDDIYLNGLPTATSVISSDTINIDDLVDKTEITFWRKAKNKNKKIYFLGYLSKYGEKGRFSQEAHSQIKRIDSEEKKKEAEQNNDLITPSESVEYFNSL